MPAHPDCSGPGAEQTSAPAGEPVPRARGWGAVISSLAQGLLRFTQGLSRLKGRVCGVVGVIQESGKGAPRSPSWLQCSFKLAQLSHKMNRLLAAPSPEARLQGNVAETPSLMSPLLQRVLGRWGRVSSGVPIWDLKSYLHHCRVRFLPALQ